MTHAMSLAVKMDSAEAKQEGFPWDLRTPWVSFFVYISATSEDMLSELRCARVLPPKKAYRFISCHQTEDRFMLGGPCEGQIRPQRSLQGTKVPSSQSWQ